MATKKTAKAEPAPVKEQSTPEHPATELPYNPATDPNLSAQERLDALTEQQEASRNVGTYPIEPGK